MIPSRQETSQIVEKSGQFEIGTIKCNDSYEFGVYATAEQPVNMPIVEANKPIRVSHAMKPTDKFDWFKPSLCSNHKQIRARTYMISMGMIWLTCQSIIKIGNLLHFVHRISRVIHTLQSLFWIRSLTNWTSVRRYNLHSHWCSLVKMQSRCPKMVCAHTVWLFDNHGISEWQWTYWQSIVFYVALKLYAFCDTNCGYSNYSGRQFFFLRLLLIPNGVLNVCGIHTPHTSISFDFQFQLLLFD